MILRSEENLNDKALKHTRIEKERKKAKRRRNLWQFIL